jgi:hypothetical protein
MLSRQKNGTLIAFDAGFVVRTDDAVAFEYSQEVDTKSVGDVMSISEYEGTPVVATELALFRLDFPDLTAFTPEAPETVVGIVAIRSAGSTLWIFDGEGIYRLRAGKWEEIEIPPELLAIPFRGVQPVGRGR